MKLLVIDTVNFFDYPTGGILAFYKAMMPSCQNNLILAGIATDDLTPVGNWSKRTIEGVEYDYYTLYREIPNAKRPLIPGRFKASVLIKKHLGNVLRTAPSFDYIFTQSHEVLCRIPDLWLKKTCFVSAGVSNPLSISRYPWARNLANLYYRYYFMPKAAKVGWHLAAADRRSIEEFANRSNGRIKANDIISFPTRYNDHVFKVLPQSECRIKLGLKEDVDLFVTVGRLGWFKGWKLVIDAFSIYKRERDNSLLVFIGDGEDENKIKEYVRELKLDDAIILIGKKTPSEIAVYLNAANVFVMGSYKEGWSTTLVEACACGVPCVVTDFSSADEMITSGKNGFVVKTRNPEDFASCMMDCFSLDKVSVVSFDAKFKYLSQSRINMELERILCAS